MPSELDLVKGRLEDVERKLQSLAELMEAHVKAALNVRLSNDAA